MTKILIVKSNFYKKISQMLLDGVIDELQKNNIKSDIIDIPGAFESAAVISMANKTNQYDGYIVLGCVIRGETSHYDYVCYESARGLNDLAIKNQLAIGYGILTCENMNQALDRANKNLKNKGGFAANTCLEMIKIKNSFNASR